MPRHLDLLLRQWKLFPIGHQKLPRHQIDPGNHLRHRMLDLQARIHFQKPEAVQRQRPIAVNDKLNRTCALIANRLSELHCRARHRLAHIFRHIRRRRFLNHLLPTSLQ